MTLVSRRSLSLAAVVAAGLTAIAAAGGTGGAASPRAGSPGAAGDAQPLFRPLAPQTLNTSVGPPIYPSKNTTGQGGTGGTAVTYRSGGRLVSDAALTALAPTPRLWHTGYGGWEPTLGFDKKGTLFVSSRNSNVDPGVVRSRDNGLTWDSINPDAHKVSLDPYIWVDPATGRLFDSDVDPTVTCPPFSHSDDQGKTWKTSVSCGVADHQSVFGGPPPAGGAKPSGYPNVVYFCAISGGATSGSSTVTGCSKSLDGGDTFTPTQPAYGVKTTNEPTQPWCDGGAGHGIVDNKGNAYVPRTWCGSPYLAISHDEGDTWAQVKVADKPQQSFVDGGFPHESGVAADRAGNLYYSWVADDNHPHLAISRDGGTTWSAPLDVMPPGVDRLSMFTASIDAADPGKIAMVFMGTNDATSVAPEKTRWNAYVVTSTDALSADPTFYATTMNDPATNALWIGGDCSSLRCGNVGDFLDVVIGPDGTAWTALIDACPNNDQCTPFGVTDPRGETIAGQLVGGTPLVGTVADQLPTISPPATPSASGPPAATAPSSTTAPGPRSSCRRRRDFRITLHQPRRGRLRSAVLRVNGKKVRVVRGAGLTKAIRLRGLPRGRATVTIVAFTSTGRKVTRTWRLHICRHA